jgi:predicted permease
MGVILDVVAPVFLLIGLGYGAARWRFIEAAGLRGLNGFVFSLAAPALLFHGGITGTGGGGQAALAFFLGAAVLYAGVLLAGRRLFRLRLGEAAMLALDASFGNTVMMGIPLVLAAFGQPGLTLLLAILAVHSLLLLGVTTVVAEIGQNAHAPWWRVLRATAGGVLRNPIVVAVLAALAWRLLALPLPPAFITRTLQMLGAAAPPVALFCLGASLLSFDARTAWRETLLATVLKLALLPLLVWLAALALALPPLETAVAVVVAAMPTGANAFLLAQRYRVGAARSGATVLVSTLLSVASLALLLALFQAE